MPIKTSDKSPRVIFRIHWEI